MTDMKSKEILKKICLGLWWTFVKVALFCILIIMSIVEILAREVNLKIRKRLYPNRK